MTQLQIINHAGHRVLLTAHLAESFGAESKIITNNFSRNKERYTEGKHYFELRGLDLEDFKTAHQIDATLKFASILYLWTEKGAWMHAKSLNTDKAWEAYEMLVDDYYSVKLNTAALSPELQMFSQIFNSVAQMELATAEQAKRLDAVEQRVEQTNEILALNPLDGRKKVTALLNKIAQSLGGGSSYQDVRSDSYKHLEERARCDLSKRVTNKKQRLSLEGTAKSKVDKISKLDVIFDDARLTEVYFAIVKEMAVQNRIDPGMAEGA
ncbi:ORF6N domain-containing protein [Paenibacillus sp. HN-1]|uniref:ORF6N domain-containing protein n=1 Tax=Paenibacillus TaxID=44249 RepID=UPI001CA7EAF1|nr:MULTISPECIES: ORF6N domain-containing protein [Paenibacillus]MBY9078271.1 ORF6N domain-containing protein [Paenibacillus sp. CGMCC 1.18879]MBY9086070.1 ORF6N domain-containing protein [Paenibacillus sinensis]